MYDFDRHERFSPGENAVFLSTIVYFLKFIRKFLKFSARKRQESICVKSG